MLVFYCIIEVVINMLSKLKQKNLNKNIILIILFICLVIYGLYYYNVIPHFYYYNSYFNIETYFSQIDLDNDGIDDQTDILMSARAYIKSKPKYKSKYYATGYPDDNYGVCTDVVAFALLNSGYDLMNLVNNDIKNNRDKYNIDIIDKNIDFRRVQNLNVYFKNNAVSLTTNLKDIDNWQGGDIVVFKTHIALVSDKRNIRGIPFIIHHGSSSQLRYEEDVLPRYSKDIIGHYRVS